MFKLFVFFVFLVNINNFAEAIEAGSIEPPTNSTINSISTTSELPVEQDFIINETIIESGNVALPEQNNKPEPLDNATLNGNETVEQPTNTLPEGLTLESTETLPNDITQQKSPSWVDTVGNETIPETPPVIQNTTTEIIPPISDDLEVIVTEDVAPPINSASQTTATIPTNTMPSAPAVPVATQPVQNTTVPIESTTPPVQTAPVTTPTQTIPPQVEPTPVASALIAPTQTTTNSVVPPAPAVTQSATSPTTTTQATAPAKKEDLVLNPIADDYYKDFTSFMLGNSTLKIIQKALTLNSNKGAITNETTVDEDGNVIQQEETYTQDIGNIHLKSIMYLSDKFWSVWINDKKITNINNYDDDNEFIIKKVNTKSATILLRVSKTKWSYINSTNKIPEEDYYVLDDHIEFEFSLAPNQTFVASKNEIIDGKYINEEEKLIDSIEDVSNIDLDTLFNPDEFSFSDIE